MKSIPPSGTINLYDSEIVPATKSDTRKKNAFIISNKELKVMISVANETIYAEWLDAIMRELISKKENPENQDTDLVQLLTSIPFNAKPELTEATSNTEGISIYMRIC